MTQSVAPPVPPVAPEPTARSRRPSRGRPGWSVSVLLIALAVVGPVAAVLVDVANGELPDWPRNLGDMVVTTLLLMAGVGIGTLVLGCGLAWLVTACTFPLRNVMVWLLVLPLAMPAYILGFVFLSIFDAAGPVQQWLRSALGDFVEFSVATLPGCVIVMSLTLYPYVYLLARAAFAEQAPSTYDAARTLGAGRGRAFFRVLLPLARPSIAAGLALVMMEVLTDFATVQYFGVQTVSVGVYTVWKGSYDFGSAVQLAALVMLFAVAVLAGERLMRGRARFTQQGGHGRGLQPVRLSVGRGLLALLACLLALAGSFVVPVLQLVWWAVDHARGDGPPALDSGFAQAFSNSISIAVITSLTCVVLALVIGHAIRLGGGRWLRAAAQLTTFGYAVPGAVIGIGTLLLFDYLDRALEALGVPGGTGLLVTGSVVGILYAFVVRFVGPASQAVDASYQKVPVTLTQSALSLGAGPLRVLGRVHAPLVRSGVAVALVLVAIDAIKELPVVLMLRPFGFNTVSVWVYQLAKENLWGLAALPALVIVALAVVPVFILFRQVRTADTATRQRRSRGSL
ncbi:iron ABC transporter permease [Nocardioides guangzhouensis]|uniref:Iron ABC transporter permease n=1 Tax=Nocardioides guangzhouensis TaxID=2497878 RepID=A0A4Q4Z5Q5_9ACTN|nr:iron ABC transporter permease [Nocardioides guangzhouensis]RYP82391.1 iron ABC transporter permease [Nocardioides guangzhouensis]